MELPDGLEIFDFNIDRSQRRKWATGFFLPPNSPFFSEHVEIAIGERNGQSQPGHIHFHKQAKELYLLIAGSLTIRIQDEYITLSPMQMIVIPPLISHAIFKTTDNTKFVTIKSPSIPNDKVLVL